MTEASGIFASLDAPFVNFEKGVEPIVWQSSDILVMQTYDLKVPTLAGSTVRYSFSTKLGDISFTTEFHAPGQPKQVIVAPMRVPSDIETIKGTFKSEVDGTFTFLFDNSFSWFNSKLLSYSIHLFQPAFTLADQNRVKQSHRLLQSTVEDSRRANVRLITARERSSVLGNEIASLEARMAALGGELENKKSVLKAAKEEVHEMSLRIQYNMDKRNGLCIRTLENKILSHVLGFVGKSPSSYLVCKYWKVTVDEQGKPQKKIASK